MEARAVIGEMVQRYAGFKSYSDTGEVTFTHPDFVTKTRFSTYYSAPSLFRFEFRVPHPHPPLSHVVSQHAVGFDGTKAYAIRKAFKGDEKLEWLDSIGLAIAGASAISCGSALTIGRLLVADMQGLAISELIDAEFNEDTVVDQVTCYSIAAQYASFPGKCELQIEKEALLLRRLLSEHKTSSFQESRMNIRINEPIDDAVFAATLRDRAA